MFTAPAIFTLVMNMPLAVNQGDQLEATALQLLRNVPGVQAVETEVRVGHDRRVDGVIRFQGNRIPVIFEVKRHANVAAAWQLIDHARHLGTGTYAYVLIAGETTVEARKLLADHGIGLIDGLGNAHVELPGILVHIEQSVRRTPKQDRTGTPRLAGKAGVVAQALLREPQRAWKVADAAQIARVSTGLAHRVLARLESEDVMTAKGTGPQRVRHVANPTVLLDLWAEETQAEKRRRALGYVVGRTPEDRLLHIVGLLNFAGIPYAVTGAAAATRTAPLITAIPIMEVWLPAARPTNDLFEAVDAQPVTEGANLVLLQAKDDTALAFTRTQDGVEIVNVFRLYADLRRDPRRGREQADNLRQEVIGF